MSSAKVGFLANSVLSQATVLELGLGFCAVDTLRGSTAD